MTRVIPIACIALCGMGACASAEQPAPPATDAAAAANASVVGPAVVVRPVPTVNVEHTLTTSVLLACESNLFVKVDADSSEDVARRLRRRSNNPYALAVNTGNVARADKAVVSAGRVLLRATGGESDVHLAQTDE